MTQDALGTAETAEPPNHTAPLPSARPGREGEPLKCYLSRHPDPGRLGHQYDVIFEGEVIAVSHDPEFNAARALRDRGYTGRLQFFRLFMSGPEPDLTMRDLVRSADHSATPDGRFFRHHPFPGRGVAASAVPSAIDALDGRSQRSFVPKEE